MRKKSLHFLEWLFDSFWVFFRDFPLIPRVYVFDFRSRCTCFFDIMKDTIILHDSEKTIFISSFFSYAYPYSIHGSCSHSCFLYQGVSSYCPFWGEGSNRSKSRKWSPLSFYSTGRFPEDAIRNYLYRHNSSHSNRSLIAFLRDTSSGIFRHLRSHYFLCCLWYCEARAI